MRSVSKSAPDYRQQLEDYVIEQFGIKPAGIQEIPHVLSFIEYCLTRPIVRNAQGRRIKAPLCSGLANLVTELIRSYRESGDRCPVTRRSRRFAEKLRRQHGGPRRKAKPLLPTDIRSLFRVLKPRRRRDLRLRAILSLLYDSWCRPAEIFGLNYPEDVLTEYNIGIVLVVHQSKRNKTQEPELIPIAHAKKHQICPVCALKAWVDALEPGYHGPLFPAFGEAGKAGGARVLSGNFSKSLRGLIRRRGKNPKAYSGYSTRRGAATAAAIDGLPWSEIQRKLRHENLFQSTDYIGADALVKRARSALDPS